MLTQIYFVMRWHKYCFVSLSIIAYYVEVLHYNEQWHSKLAHSLTKEILININSKWSNRKNKLKFVLTWRINLLWSILWDYEYRIRPYYHTVRLGFSKLLGNLWQNMTSSILRVHLNKIQWRTYQMMLMRCYCVFFFSDFLNKSICCGYSFELHRQVDAIQMGTHNIYLYKDVYKNYTGCNLKTTELLDCALIGVCALIRSNMVYLVHNRVLNIFPFMYYVKAWLP